MNKFKEIANKLFEDEEFAEESIRGAAERSALRDLLREEQELDNGMSIAALDEPDDEPDGNNDSEKN